MLSIHTGTRQSGININIIIIAMPHNGQTLWAQRKYISAPNCAQKVISISNAIPQTQSLALAHSMTLIQYLSNRTTRSNSTNILGRANVLWHNWRHGVPSLRHRHNFNARTRSERQQTHCACITVSGNNNRVGLKIMFEREWRLNKAENAKATGAPKQNGRNRYYPYVLKCRVVVVTNETEKAGVNYAKHDSQFCVRLPTIANWMVSHGDDRIYKLKRTANMAG